MDKTLGLLGLVKKAGKLAIGGESTAIAARQGKAYLIITANDASDSTVRRAAAGARSAGIDHIPVSYSRFELGQITGRGSPGVLAVLDKGLAENIKQRLPQGKAAQEKKNGRKESNA